MPSSVVSQFKASSTQRSLRGMIGTAVFSPRGWSTLDSSPTDLDRASSPERLAYPGTDATRYETENIITVSEV